MRLFVGVPLPAEVRESLGNLCSGVPGARWVDTGNMHVSLRFIGEVDSTQAEDIDAALGDVRQPAFELALGGVGCFASGRKVRAVWAGVAKSDGLAHLRDKVESAIVRAGFEPERRKFKPHVTLARFRNTASARVGPYLETHNAFAAGPFPVDRFDLLRSYLSHTGARYQTIADYPLGDQGVFS